MAGVEAGKLIRREVRVAGGEPRTVLKDAGSKCNTFSGWHHSLIHDKVPFAANGTERTDLSHWVAAQTRSGDLDFLTHSAPG